MMQFVKKISHFVRESPQKGIPVLSFKESPAQELSAPGKRSAVRTEASRKMHERIMGTWGQ